MARARSEKIMTPEFRGAFVQLLKPKGIKGDPDSKKKYSVTAVFRPDQKGELAKIRSAVEQCARDEFGENWEKLKLHMPWKKGSDFVNGDGDLYDGFTDDAICMTLSSNDPVGVVDRNLNDLIEEADVYSGAIYRATINAYAWVYGNNVKKGVSLGLHNVQKVKEGDRLGSVRVKAQSDFAAYSDPDEDGEDDGDDPFA